MNWLSEQWKQIRGNLKWEVIKWIAQPIAASSLLGALYVLLQKLRNLTWDWWVFGALFIVSLLLLLLLLLLSRDKRVPTTTQIQHQSNDRPFDNPQWQVVNGIQFKNQTVKVDNKRFYNCTFDNVTMEYDGEGPFEMIHCQSNGQIVVETSNPVARGYAYLVELLQSFSGEIKHSSLDKDGHLRPTTSRVRLLTQPAKEDSILQQSSVLGRLPFETWVNAGNEGPQIHLHWEYRPEAARGVGDLRKCLQVENASPTDDAFNVTINDVVLDENAVISAWFKAIQRLTRLETRPVQVILNGAVPEGHNEEFEMVYYNAKTIPEKYLTKTKSGALEQIKFPMTVSFFDYGGTRYRAHFEFAANTINHSEEIVYVRREKLLLAGDK